MFLIGADENNPMRQNNPMQLIGGVSSALAFLNLAPTV
jgi:hypothetical protein